MRIATPGHLVFPNRASIVRTGFGDRASQRRKEELAGRGHAWRAQDGAS
ncbi:MAG: hypothetical protein L0Y60_16080 [Beijerinckiaceae bacterium]|nr:hypothetical protein [Beijerinckiaceae bacterium]